MKEEELQEVMNLLRESGLSPMLCDTPVPVCNSSVVCGLPKEPGNADFSEYFLLPKSLVGNNPEMLIMAEGSSMRDAGIEPGDMLRVRLTDVANDGDTIIAYVDGCCTVKVLFTDENGQKWLVPRNEDYEPILLTVTSNARTLGIVVGISKAAPRASAGTMYRAIHRAKKERDNSQKEEVPMPDFGGAIRGYDTCFFIVNEEQTFGECERQLYNILGSNKVKARVLRKLFGEEGRRYFDLVDRDVVNIVDLLNQFPSQCGAFSVHMVKKVLAEFRPIIERQRLNRLNRR